MSKCSVRIACHDLKEMIESYSNYFNFIILSVRICLRTSIFHNLYIEKQELLPMTSNYNLSKTVFT